MLERQEVSVIEIAWNYRVEQERGVDSRREIKYPVVHTWFADLNCADPMTWWPFLEGMKELGYVEGRNLTVKRAFGGGRAGQVPTRPSLLAR